MGVTRDVMGMTGKVGLREMRAAIDEKWSRVGPATRTPLP